MNRAFYVCSVSIGTENYSGIFPYKVVTHSNQSVWIDGFLEIIKRSISLPRIDNSKIRVNFISMLSKIDCCDDDVWRSATNIMNPDEIDTSASPYKDDKVNQFILLGLSHLRNAGKFFVSIDVRNTLSKLLLGIAEDYQKVVGVKLDYYALDDPHESLFDDYFDTDKMEKRVKQEEEEIRRRRAK